MSAVVERIDPPALPQVLASGGEDRPLLFDGNGEIALGDYFAEVRGVAAQLPAGRHVINLCEDRYRFLVAFGAAALRGQATLLPSSRAPAVVDEVRARYPDSYCLGDQDFADTPPHYWRLPQSLPRRDGAPPMIEDDAVVAIGFTSGSTGCPKPNAKTWGGFRTSTAQNLAALRDLWPAGAIPRLVATVPPQHMYGMEMTVLMPLLGGAAVHAGRPFYPGDVARALQQASAPRVLVTTPVHLRALVESGIELPPLAGIVSATAPLPQALAAAAEARFGGEVREVFGSTETCVIARRRTACEDAWTLMPGVRLAPQPDGTLVHAAHLDTAVALADLVELDGEHRFHLRGRNADLLEIAGKRASLGDLTRKLLSVPGVEDGVVFQPDEADDAGVRRVAALVVAPTLDETQILRHLQRGLDAVFLPRPLLRVAALPRNETGKLPRDALQALLRSRMP
ncbi:acyl-coenzyme A synthetase/AMP-(fatty) acid ligase [Luteimonas cucumeris]|uniref:Acyl-coenzyme A synthetase/AMP-(Fatty) acid ligase n=1 Tax=Luteimonas cucumeris TaxID=985012 RepID=A0A562KX50_9GAMM|nr:AMP-binding protein [Luteimonas cucumeris]TWH99944.1 acyl-coenzyme A synthetase/AMP-(fatty) acid ligase [Luteimonas cucumeris]